MADYDGECMYYVEPVKKPKHWTDRPKAFMKSAFEFILTVTFMLSMAMVISLTIHSWLPDLFALASMYSILTMYIAMVFTEKVIKAARNYRRKQMIYLAALMHSNFMAKLVIFSLLDKPIPKDQLDKIREQMLDHLADTINKRLGK